MAARSADAIVVGGGLVGSAIAWGLQHQGLATLLLDEGDVAFRASRGNFGLVWVQSKGLGAPHYQRWTRASAENWPSLAADLAARTGLDCGLQQGGGVHLCLTEQELEQRSRRMARMQEEAGNFGYDYRMLDAAEARDLLPGLGPEVRGASWTPYDGHANPLNLLHALHRSFTLAGGAYVREAKVIRAQAALHDFRIGTAAGEFSAPRLVLAAGLGNAELAPLFGLSTPVRPQRGQILVTERTTEALPMPTTTIRQTSDGTLLLGDSQEEVGFDLRQDPAVMAAVADRAIRCFPWIGRLSIIRAWSALRVMAPDGLPIYDESETYAGAFAANCHSGVTLAAAHAALFAPMVARGALDPGMEAFSARRFQVTQAA
ncbi:MAG: FAD-binding oxidoreductase [Rubritepida sp.]|nr:FAD-binding oxidoreductase [Rubritepida sp.]